MHAWVRHQPGSEKAAAYTELRGIGTPDEQITRVLDNSAYHEAWRAAIALHAAPAQRLAPVPAAAHLRRPRISPAATRRSQPGPVQCPANGVTVSSPTAGTL
ncbi:MAG: hypothetical protein WKF73_01140 [Nocardioidaceae bacterium]